MIPSKLAYFFSSVISLRLLNAEKIETCAMRVIPVIKTNLNFLLQDFTAR